MRTADIDVAVEDVLERLGVDIVAERGEWADCLCPLHEESRPSFSVNLEHGGWVCRHGSNTGNLLQLVAWVKKLTPREAVHWLRGMPKVVYSSDDVLDLLIRHAKKSHADTLVKWLSRYEELDPSVMSEYWFERGFNGTTLHEFGVRYDDEDNSIVVPIRDENANLKSFVKRLVPPLNGRSKYDYPIGSETTLFPLDHFETNKDHAVLVEGPLDALWLHQLGYYEALALCGSGVTRSQEQWIRRNLTSVTLMLDNDNVGKEAVEKAQARLAGLLVRVAKIPPELKDPQEMNWEQVYNACREAEYTV